MKRKLKKGPKVFLRTIGVLIIFCLVLFYISTRSVGIKSKAVTFEVIAGSTFSSLADSLKKNNLIKSEFFYKLYVKINNPGSLQVGIYELNENMSVSEIIDELETGTIISNNLVMITFKEGVNIPKLVNLITKNTNITEDEISSVLKDQDYLNELIEKYWFIDDSIKNNDIYYSLEGYLFPDTYQLHMDGNIKAVFKVMLDNTASKLEEYKDDIENSDYTIHEILTLASIVELEAANSDDRAGVAGVFYNRLESGWSLGSDVTTYYASGIDVTERPLYQVELDEFNAYNTRNSKMAGKLPVGPICMPGIESISAAINPKEHNYFYFVADKNKKTYFRTTEYEHLSIIAKLKRDGLWYEY